MQHESFFMGLKLGNGLVVQIDDLGQVDLVKADDQQAFTCCDHGGMAKNLVRFQRGMGDIHGGHHYLRYL